MVTQNFSTWKDPQKENLSESWKSYWISSLLDGDGDADGVDGGLDEDALLLVPGDDHRVQQHLGRLSHLNWIKWINWIFRLKCTVIIQVINSMGFKSITYPVFILLLTSISGLLCRSTFCEEKFSTHMAACRVRFTAIRYGFSVADCKYSED